MEKKQEYMVLPCFFEIFVPGTNGAKFLKRWQRARLQKRVERYLGHLFGGCTTTPARGLWLSNGQYEHITRVLSCCTDAQYLEHFAEIVTFCKAIARLLHQEAITLNTNKGMLILMNE